MRIVQFPPRNAKVLRNGTTRHSRQHRPPHRRHIRSGIEVQGPPDTEAAMEG